MLSLNIKSGEYITIGNDIVVQIFREGSDARVEVKAPREMTILRGELLERTEKKPDGLLSIRPKSASERIRNAKRLDKLAEKKAFYEAQKQEILAIAGKMDQLTASISDPDTKAHLKELAVTLFQMVVGENGENIQGA